MLALYVTNECGLRADIMQTHRDVTSVSLLAGSSLFCDVFPVNRLYSVDDRMTSE
jgi:hypothetical protein